MTTSVAGQNLEPSSPAGERDSRQPTILVTLLKIAIAIALFRMLMAGLHGIDILGDSARYRPDQPGESALSLMGWWDGRSPGFTVQLVNALPGWLTASIQGLVAGIAWGLCALTAAASARGRAGSIALFTLISLWGIAPWFEAWDTAAMTESLTYSGAAVAVGGAFLVVAPRADQRLNSLFALNHCGELFLFGGVILLMCTRSSAVTLWAPFVLGVWWLARKCKTSTVSSPVAKRLSIALVAVFAAAAVFTGLQAQQSAAWWAQNRMGLRGNNVEYQQLASRSGMPDCPDLTQLMNNPDWSQRMNQIRTVQCPGLEQWWDGGGVGALAELTSLPNLTISRYLDDIKAQWTPSIDANSWTFWSGWIDPHIGPELNDLLGLNGALALLCISGSLCYAGFVVVRLKGRRGDRIGALAPLAVLGWFYLAVAVYSVGTYLENADDVRRVSMPATALVPVATLLALAMSWASLRTRTPTLSGTADLPGSATTELTQPVPR